MQNNLIRYRRLLFAGSLCLFLLSCGVLPVPVSESTGDTSCEKNVLALDIGSGATKMQLARVDACQGKVLQTFYQGREAVAYQDALNNHSHKRFDEAIRRQGLEALMQLQAAANSVALADRQCGVATAAFREALNAGEVLDVYSSQTGIPFRVISQAEEAELGFGGVVARSGEDPMDVLVWDIGGGSMQLSYLEPDGKHHVVNVPWGAIDFRDALIREQGREGAASPNPVSESDALLASVLVTLLLDEVPDSVLRAIKGKKAAVGIGGVHNFSLYPRFGQQDGFSRSSLQQGLPGLLDKTDAELGGGNFVSTRVSDVLLVMAVMEFLDIPALRVMAVNNTEALLLSACESF